jgi:hypothetical protein
LKRELVWERERGIEKREMRRSMVLLEMLEMLEMFVER